MPTSFTRPLPPADCRRILIVGAGGFGREVAEWAWQTWPDHAHLVAGMLSEDADCLAGTGCPLALVGRPSDFEPAAGDLLLLGIGIPRVRRQVTEGLLARGGRFLTLVHPTAVVAASARLGTGVVICPQAIVSVNTRLGDYAVLNYHTSLGHDASVGDFSVLSPYATLGGSAAVGADVFMGLHATVGPRISVGDRVVISANSCALSAVPADSLVYGVPGRSAPRIAPGM
jgi:sugar O-acyltransferase (sialic acid O-acetyltransferase NeuD family)